MSIVRPIPGTPTEQLQRTIAVIQHSIDSIVRRASPDSVAQIFLENSRLYAEIQASRRVPAKDIDVTALLERFEAAVQSSKIGSDGDELDDDDESVVRLEDSRWTLVTFQPRKIAGIHSRREVDTAAYLQKSNAFLDCFRSGYTMPRLLRTSCLLVSVAIADERLKMKSGQASATKIIHFVRNG
jgi:hypothetical protein